MQEVLCFFVLVLVFLVDRYFACFTTIGNSVVTLYLPLIGSLSSTFDTNNKSCPCAVLAKSQRRSVLEVATTEVRAILVVVGIEMRTYINPVFYKFFSIKT